MTNRDSNKKRYANKRIFTGAIISMAAVFLVTILNLVMLSRMLQRQVTELGTQNIANMQNNLQTLQDDAAYMTRALAEEAQSLVDEGATEAELREWVAKSSERQQKLTDGYCFNVCYTSPDLIIVPGYEVAEGFDIHSRTWYDGALETGVGKVYISEPYVDLASTKVCYTSVVLLKDGISTVSLDFTMEATQSMISALEGENGEAIIVNSEKLLMGCANASILGSKLSDYYPDYVDVLDNLAKSSDKIGHIDDGKNTVFYCVTDNGWCLVYVLDKMELFADTYMSMLRNIILSSILLVVIVILMVNNMRSHRRIKEALDDREQFFNNISGELKNPVSRILVESNPENMENSVDTEENMKAIRESAMKLSGLVDNMLAYSGIQSGSKNEKKTKLKHQKNKAMGKLGSLAVILLVFCIIIDGIFAFRMMRTQANSEMERNVEVASAKLTRWMTSRKNATDMLAKTIEANPSVMDDYDGFVAFLEKLCEENEDVSLIYVGNANNKPSVVMSDGWVAETGYIVQAYSWYSQALNDESGYAVSQPFFDTTVRAYCVTISRPMYDSKGKFLGVLGMDYTLDSITSEFEAEYDEVGYAFLVTDSGLIINHPNGEYAISTSNRVDVRSLNYYEAMTSDGYKTIRDYDGKIKMCISKSESISGFNVVLLRKANVIIGAAALTSIVFILILITCIILIAILGRRMAKWYETTNEGLQNAVERATAADKAKMQFLAQISHELRTPINAVLGMDELIMRESDDSDILGYATDIQTAGHNLLELVNGLLDFSKIENGKMTLQEVEYNTSYMLKNTLNSVTDRARRAGLELITDIDPQLPSLLYGDDLKVRQVVVNLLTNAIKYTPAGSVTFTVKLLSVKDKDASIFFSVKDTGIGIKPEDRDSLFKSFSRLDQEKNRTIEGTGLGLYIVNKILKMMNTRLELDSVYGEGSDFHFTVVQKVIDSIAVGSLADGEGDKETAVQNKTARFLIAPEARVLVVDDNAVNLKVAQGLLKRNELKVDTVDSGNACLEKLREDNKYDIIFLDHMMPVMDGVEVLGHIRSEGLISGDVPVIVMTANAISGAREEYMELGFDDYISKPLDVSVLEGIFAKWLPADKVDYKTVGENAVKKTGAGNVLQNSDANTGVAAADEATPVIQSDSSKTEALADEFAEIKIVTLEDLEDDVAAMDEDNDEFTDADKAYFAESIPEVDIEVGIRYASGSRSFYIEIAEEMIKTKADEELQGYFDALDYADYKVRVHAMKNNLKTIGAVKLGEDAFALETAAKENRIDFIKENHERLNSAYADVMSKIDKWINK